MRQSLRLRLLAGTLVWLLAAVLLTGWGLRALFKEHITEQLQQRSPGRSLEQISSARLRQNGLYAYTAISAPRGLNERIYHVWRQEGREVDRIPLDIRGGRKDGYRAWTHKRNFPTRPEGDWQVQVVTEAGQQIGVLRFRVD